MEYNKLSDVKFTIIIPRICKTNIQEIYLHGNLITENNIFNLLNAIQSKNTLRILSFGNKTEISVRCAEIINHLNAKFSKLEIICGRIVGDKSLPEVDFGEILLKRCKYLAMKPKLKKHQRNMDQFFAILRTGDQFCEPCEFEERIVKFGAKLNENLIKQMLNHWSIGSTNEIVTDLHLMAKDYEKLFNSNNINI